MFTSGASLPVNMTMGDSGIPGGTIAAGTLIPVSWDFNMTPLSGSGTIDSWILTFGLGSSAGGTNFGSASTSGGSIGSSGSTIIGGPINLQVLSTLVSGSTLFECVSLTMDVTTNLGVQVTVFQPRSEPGTSTPSPQRGDARAGHHRFDRRGLAFFGALLRRRRKQ